MQLCVCVCVCVCVYPLFSLLCFRPKLCVFACPTLPYFQPYFIACVCVCVPLFPTFPKLGTKLVALFLAFPKLDTLFPTFLKIVMCYFVSKIFASWSFCCCDPFFQTIAMIFKNIEIGWCIHGNKFWLFMFSCKRLLLSWLLLSYLSFLFSSLLLLHSYKKFMLSYK